jgi:uncharacterized membrane protein YeiH
MPAAHVEVVAHLPTWIDVTAVAVGALSGALVAVRSRFDISGILIMAIVTGLGGGMIRDILLQQGAPVALTSGWLLPTALAVGVVIFLFSRTIHAMHARLSRVVIVADALVLGIYSVVGTEKGLEAHLPGVSCVLLGVLTGVGGGLLRDVLVNEQPELLKPGAVIAMTAVIGCTLYVVAIRVAHLVHGFSFAAIAVIVALRIVAAWRGWESPVATDVLSEARRRVPKAVWRRGASDPSDPDAD